MTNYDEKPQVNISNKGDNSAGVAIIIAAIILVVGGFIFFSNGFGPTTDNAKIVQNNTTLPAPVIDAPAAPEVITPPAAQPNTPSSEAPATNP